VLRSGEIKFGSSARYSSDEDGGNSKEKGRKVSMLKTTSGTKDTRRHEQC